MNQKKILSAITSAIGHLENSMKLLSSKNEKEASDAVWQASSDVEYCLFLLLLLHSNEAENFSSKHKFSKPMEIRPALTCALDMLEEAKTSVKNNDLATAYEKTWQARSYLFKVHEIFEKKRKIGAERSSIRS